MLRSQPWPLLIQVCFAQATTFLIRPSSTYRALELGIDSAWLGLLAAAFSLLPLVMAAFVGHFVDQGNTRSTLIGGATLMALAAAGLLCWSSSLTLLLVWNALLGAGFICCVVSQQTIVAHRDPKRVDANFGMFTFVNALGQSLGPLALTVLSGQAALPNTRLLFAVSVGCAVVALVLAVAMRTQDEDTGRPGEGPPRQSLRDALKTPSGTRGKLLSALVISMIVLVAIDLLTVYLPAWGMEKGISAAMVGVLLTIRSVATMLSRLGLGTMARKFGRSTLIMASTMIAAIAIFILVFTNDVVIAGLVLFVAGVGLGIGQPLTMASVSVAAQPGAVGLWLSIRLSGNSLGLVVIPPVVGLVSGALGVTGVFGILAGTLTGVAGLAWIDRR